MRNEGCTCVGVCVFVGSVTRCVGGRSKTPPGWGVRKPRRSLHECVCMKPEDSLGKQGAEHYFLLPPGFKLRSGSNKGATTGQAEVLQLFSVNLADLHKYGFV